MSVTSVPLIAGFNCTSICDNIQCTCHFRNDNAPSAPTYNNVKHNKIKPCLSPMLRCMRQSKQSRFQVVFRSYCIHTSSTLMESRESTKWRWTKPTTLKFFSYLSGGQHVKYEIKCNSKMHFSLCQESCICRYQRSGFVYLFILYVPLRYSSVSYPHHIAV